MSLFKPFWVKVATGYFVVVVFWWLKIFFQGNEVGLENYLFNFSYLFFNLSAGFGGLIIARRKWGGFASRVGRGISFLAIGQLFQGFGLVVWTYYNIVLQIEVPYPSVADVGYHLLIPAYIYGMYNLAVASGVHVSLRGYLGKVQALIVPIIMLGIAYALFLRDLPVDFNDPIRTYLDWGTPALNAISISIGILTYSLSVNLLGGKMKGIVLFLVFALTFEYITEYVFLYRAGLELYYNADFTDLMFAASAFIMTLGIFQLKTVADKLTENKK